MRLPEIKSTAHDIESRVRKFADWAIKKLALKRKPNIEYSHDLDKVKQHRTFGTTLPDSTVWVYLGNRNSADIMRTLVHELIHCKQFELGTATPNMDEEQRQSIEDEANAIAGRIMREYGKQNANIYEWKMSKSMLTEEEFVSAYNEVQKRQRRENSEIKFRPASLFATTLSRLSNDILWESNNSDIKQLKNFQRYLFTLDGRSRVKMKAGSKLAVLQFEPHTYQGVIEVKGFTTPKRIVNIEYKADGIVDWIEFSDGSTFPDKEFLNKGKGGGEFDGISTLFFPDSRSAQNALMLAKLHGADDWEISTVNIGEQLTESSSGSTLTNIVDEALRDIGMSDKRAIGSGVSTESKSVSKNNPVIPFRDNPR